MYTGFLDLLSVFFCVHLCQKPDSVEPEPKNSTRRRQEAKPQRFFDSLFARFLRLIPSLLLTLFKDKGTKILCFSLRFSVSRVSASNIFSVYNNFVGKVPSSPRDIFDYLL